MGKSTTSSCLKIITCGSNTGGQDELELQDNIPAESKGSSDKRRWSFRKRTANHRVLSNSVATESPSSGNNDGSDPTAAEFQAPVESVVTEKISLEHWDNEKPLSTSCSSKVNETNEKSLLSAPFNPKVSETKDDTTNGDCKAESKLQEADAIVIQAAIRGFLGRQELQKLKNVVKLQAAVRGHLVRRHAVGTLRCAQAIVKMQALVRARRACILLDQSCLEEDLDGEPTEKQSSKSWEKNRPKTMVTYTSISKLLSNRFARQLLDSTPRTKTINIKCDLSKPDSTWRWLERWMSASAPDLAQSPLPESDEKQKEKDNVETSAFKMESENPPEVLEELVNQQSGNTEKSISLESEENVITYDAKNFDFEACQRTSSSKAENLVSLQPQNTTILNTKEVSLDMETVPSQTMQSDANSVVELNDISNKAETENEKPKPSGKRSASEQLETEVKKFVPSSRKASNPTFIAAHSKFEELSSIANSARSFSSSSHGAVVESNTDAVSPPREYLIRTKELGLPNNLVPHDTSVHVGGSECGTELSVTSTLDSPDRFELGGEEVEHESKTSNGGAYTSLKTIDVEDKNVSHIPTPSISDCVSIQLERCDDVDVESHNLAATEDVSQVNQEPEKCAPDGQLKLEPETGHQTCKSSPTASPKSLVTVPESQGTPSSQILVKAKRGKSDRTESDKKRKSPAGKRSPANPIIHNGARSSMEQLPKDQRSGKRRNSFGSVKPDQVDQEQRNSSSSLPNYMQATESARAKAHANSSPRSSPDVQDREIYIKKRHSLPGANGRQESPRIQRSMSQTQQNTKGNSVHHERKWQR